ncbi:MAG: histidine triad nucleotide-binding protein [bacterium]
MGDCIFCKIADLETQTELVYNDDMFVAFRDINPSAPIHLLIMPKKHIPSMNMLNEIDSDTLGRIFEIAKKLAKQEGISESGYRLVINTGPDAGQTINHLHFHLLGGRELGWPPG